MWKYRRVYITVLILALLGTPVLQAAAELSAAIFVDSGVSTLTPVYEGAVAWGDSDGDGDLDLLITGNASTTGANAPVTSLYLNNGNGTFSEVPAGTTNLIKVQSSVVAWGDFNHDGRLDVALSGETSAGVRVTKVYRNDGNSTFNEINAGLVGVRAGALAWNDYNNDGALDLQVAGESQSGAVTRLYRNNSNNTFSIVNVAWPGMIQGSIAWSDFNLDGRADVLLVGPGVSKLYRNDGEDRFTEVAANLMTLNVSVAAAWGDYNLDGRPDIALVGCSATACVAKAYRNNGNGSFTDLASTGLTPVGVGAGVAWGDYDNDGRSDLLLNGNLDVSTRVFHNNGDGTFTPIEAGLPAVGSQAFAWGDFNNSSQLDIVMNGNTLAGTLLSRIFSSTIGTANLRPAPPTALSAIPAVRQVRLQWQAPIDDYTPTAGLTYQVRVGTTPGGSQIVSPPALLSSGYRQLPLAGSSLTTTALVENLKPGKYYWSVQAVDTAFIGSAFANEATFTMINYVYLPIVANNAVMYFPGPNEVEPNNTLLQANGPLASGHVYQGLHNDQWDVFSVYMPTAGTVRVNLQTPRTGNMQLQIYYQSLSDPGSQYVSVPPYQVNYTGAAGWYYIFIFNAGAFDSDSYTLTGTYP